jgi:hypothetical protein
MKYSYALLESNNPFIISPGVSMAVHGAQFVGLLVGVLFEDECPQGLQHIAFGAVATSFCLMEHERFTSG